MGFFNGAFGYPLFRINYSTTLPTDPAGTTSTTGVMSGLGILATAKRTGNFFIITTSTCSSDTNNDGTTLQLRYGTGTAPSNGAALTGTTIGNATTSAIGTANQTYEISCSGIVSNLKIGTEYWFDLSNASYIGGTSTAKSITFNIREI